eukprot:scaffold23.g4138.t1
MEAQAKTKRPLEEGEGQQAGSQPQQGEQQQPAANGGPPAKPGQQPRKRPRKATPEVEARMAIHTAAKAQDVGAALAVYDRCKAEHIKLGPELHTSLLYLCSGGEAWDEGLRGGDAAQQPQQQQPQQQEQEHAAAEGAAATAGPSTVPAPRPPPEVLVQRAQEIFDVMAAAGGALAPNEMCYTALARLAAAAGQPARALAVVRDMAAAGVAPKLRSFAPALAGFAEAGDAAAAFEVDAAIQEQGLDLTEAEYGRLLQAAAAPGGTWEQASSVLERMGHDLTVLQDATLARVRALFASPAAAAALAPPAGGGALARRWEVEPTTVDAGGVCASCGGKLEAKDLSADEFATFAEGIAQLAAKQERKPGAFQSFMDWLGRHGPFGAVVDGANVALYGQNFETGGFTFGQIRTAVEHLRSKHPELKPLVILHVGRTKAAPAQAPEAQTLLQARRGADGIAAPALLVVPASPQELRDQRSFYAAPAGSNDDWYWIYAAVSAGARGLLVSNDEMRDHLFQLLAPKYFAKWKQRHQLRYAFTPDGHPLFDYPPPYTTCTQRLECGAWIFPAADGSWLCAKPV